MTSFELASKNYNEALDRALETSRALSGARKALCESDQSQPDWERLSRTFSRAFREDCGARKRLEIASAIRRAYAQ